MFRALLVFGIVPAYMALASLLGYPAARLLGSPALLYALGRLGVRIGLLLAGTRGIVEGRRHLSEAGNTFRVRPGTVRVRVLDPMEAGRYSYETREELMAEVRGRIAAALAG